MITKKINKIIIKKILYLFIKILKNEINSSDFIDLIPKVSPELKIDINLIKAVTILEDKRYFEHNGYDLIAIIRSYFRNSLGYGYSGASTITQQVVRLITNERDISYSRKIQEIYFAIILEERLNKSEILNLYLYLNYFGDFRFNSQNKYKSLSFINIEDISINKAILVASLIKYPVPFIKNKKWERKIIKRFKKGFKAIKKDDYLQRNQRSIQTRRQI